MKLSQLKNQKAVQCDVAGMTFDETYDVIIAGLGTAGAIALIEAARRGIKVLGIEKLNCMGGSATAGGVFGYYYGVNGGMFEEIDKKSNQLRDGLMTNGGCWHVDAKKIVMEEEAVKAGADVLYDTTIIGVYVDGATVKGVRCVTPDGVKHIQCRYLIDGSGDGDVSATAGCKFTYGRSFDNASQPYSHVRQFIVNQETTYYANFDAGYMNPCDGDDMSRAIIHGGSLHLQDQFNEADKITYMAPIIGGREGRMIAGEETVTFEQFWNDDLSAEPAFIEYSNIDTHSRDWAFEDEKMQQWLTVSNLWAQNFTMPIPLGALISKDYDNLMLVGRCMSLDHNYAQCVRMQKAMQKSGEAAAIALAEALKSGVELKKIPYEQLQGQFEAAGILYREDKIPFVMITDTDELKQRLTSEDPGLAIWSAFKQIDEFESVLLDWLKTDNENLVKHSAVALGLAGRKAALPVIRKIVQVRDPYTADTRRMNKAARICSAIYLLGMLNDTEMIDELMAVAEENINFYATTDSIMALLKLAENNPAEQKRIAEGLLKLAKQPEFKVELLMKVDVATEDMTDYCRIVIAQKLDKWTISHDLYEQLDMETLGVREQYMLKKSR